jgi:hypothetical protein
MHDALGHQAGSLERRGQLLREPGHGLHVAAAQRAADQRRQEAVGERRGRPGVGELPPAETLRSTMREGASAATTSVDTGSLSGPNLELTVALLPMPRGGPA